MARFGASGSGFGMVDWKPGLDRVATAIAVSSSGRAQGGKGECPGTSAAINMGECIMKTVGEGGPRQDRGYAVGPVGVSGGCVAARAQGAGGHDRPQVEVWPGGGRG